MPTYGVSVSESTVPPWAVQQRIGTSAARYALNSMLMPRTDSGLTFTDYRSGVMASGDGGSTHLAMRVSADSGMRVAVAQGNAVINTPNQGAYMACLDSQKTITVPASSGTTRRYDLVVARVYDDNNSALSGTSGVRRFTVELVQGDASTGTPVVPSPPVGAIPLASIYVNKSVSNLTGTDPSAPSGHNSAVQDLRGPGLVARGGMRALYGADTESGSAAYEQPGAYPGDQRWVHTSGFQHQVYYGGGTDQTRSGWRGVHNCLIYNARPPSSLNGTWIKGTGSRRELCRVNVPYPGTPFMVQPTAMMSQQQSGYTSVDVYVSIDSVSGAWITRDRRDSGPVGNDVRQGWSVPPVMWGPFTASTTLYLCTNVVFAGNSQLGVGCGGIGGPAEEGLLTVAVYPSTVQPPEW